MASHQSGTFSMVNSPEAIFHSAGDRPHLMAGLIVGKGLLHFGRGGDTTAFKTEDL